MKFACIETWMPVCDVTPQMVSRARTRKLRLFGLYRLTGMLLLEEYELFVVIFVVVDVAVARWVAITRAGLGGLLVFAHRLAY